MRHRRSREGPTNLELPDPQARYRLAGHVRFTVIDGTALLMDGGKARYLGLNEVGTRILELAVAGSAAEQVVADLRQEFAADPERLRQDVFQMIAELEREGVLERRAEDGR